ncbi:hypothetical protein MNBD_ACTINO01-1001, partial [hydrothermal vent metagenome]
LVIPLKEGRESSDIAVVETSSSPMVQ